jgi:hydrogenase nickel incorporation protein HypA/HybF
MHELAICQALMEQVERIGREQQAQSVESIQLGIGPLSGVEPRLLEQAFYVARAGSMADQARLVIENTPVMVSCKQCGARTEVLPSRLLCGQCGDWRTTLISGDEMVLQNIELVRESQQDSAATEQAHARGKQINQQG